MTGVIRKMKLLDCRGMVKFFEREDTETPILRSVEKMAIDRYEESEEDLEAGERAKQEFVVKWFK